MGGLALGRLSASERQALRKALGLDLDHLAQGDMARLIGVEVRTLRRWEECPRNEDGTYPAPAVVQWRHERELVKLASRLESEDENRWLEELRKNKAKLAELELELRRGDAVSREELRRMWDPAASVLREAVQRLERAHGPEARRYIDEALDVVSRNVEAAVRGAPEGEVADECGT